MQTGRISLAAGVAVVILAAAGAATVARSGGAASPAQPPLKDAPPAPRAQKDSLAYGVGYYLGREVREGLDDDGVVVDIGLVRQGFSEGLAGGEPMIPAEELDEVLYAVHDEMQARMVVRMLEQDPEFKKLHDANGKLSADYIAAFAKGDGVKPLTDGIYYKVITAGTGASPSATDHVVVNFAAHLMDGRLFDSGERLQVRVDATMGGGSTVLQAMKVGDKWEVALPPDQAYGAAGKPPRVGPNEAIVIQVELVEIK